jgi:capsular exopolysaccharide synthesis family protein
MTIEDAIRRAKLLGQARIKGSETARQHAAEPRDHAEASPTPTRLHSGAEIPLEPLKTAEISLSACEQHRVLISDSQLREFPHADAAYRLLRSRLRNRFKRNNWFSLAIVSPSPDDGKTITAVNLAVSIAREKQKPVFLLDLDMRNPSVCKFLGITDIRQLPDFFLGHAKAHEVLVQTTFPNLIVAGALRPAESPSELLAGPRFGELLSHIQSRSPDACVLIDLPPVNITDESLLVGPRVDAFLVVVSEGKTQRTHLAQTLGTLSEFTVAGVVVNRSSESHTTAYDRYLA